MTEYEFHPLCLAFPAYQPDVYAARLAAYRDNPRLVRDAAVLLARDAGEWKIADGRHHYLICKELGYECGFDRFEGDPAELSALVLARNAHRRHADPSQIAAAIVAVNDWARGGDRGNQHTGGKASHDALPTQDETAKAAGVGRATVQRAAKVKKEAPELLPAVRDGKLDAHTAAKAADLSAEDRAEIVAAADPKAAAKEKLAAKPRRGDFPHGANVVAADPDPAADPADEFVAAVGDLCREMDQLARRMKALKDSPLCYSIHVDSAVAQVEAARKTLWQGRPAKPCPYCRATGQTAPACPACRGTGRVKASTYDAGVEAVGGEAA